MTENDAGNDTELREDDGFNSDEESHGDEEDG